MSHSPFFDTISFIQTPCHSPPLTSRAKGRSKPVDQNQHTLPLWHQGKRSDQNQHTHPLFSSCRRSVLQIWCILKWPSSPWVHVESSNINELHDSMNFLSPKTHTYIKYPTKWIYIWDSRTQPSGFTHFNSATQPSGFTNLTSSYMTEFYRFYIMGLNMTFSSKIQIWLFMTNTKKTSREII